MKGTMFRKRRGVPSPGNSRRGASSSVAIVAIVVLLGCFGWARTISAQTQVAVEYYYAVWDYYFVTSFPDEIAVLDGGAFGGVWKRTGQTFNVWSQPVSGTLATCRFFSTSFAPKSSHFYTPLGPECTTVKNDPNWQYEATAYYLQLPDAAGACAAGTAVLYRFYNNGMGGAPNHRYTTNVATFSQMRAAGWILEGDGTTGAFACVPQSAPAIATAEGLWFGSTNTGETIIGLVLDNGTFYFLYTLPGSPYIAGVVQGTATETNGQFNSSNARDFNVTGFGVTNVAIAGTRVSPASLGGAIGSSYGNAIFGAAYQTTYEQPANLSAAAGTYSGSAASSAGIRSTVVTVSASGAFSGEVAGCSFIGVASPRGTVNVFDLSVTFDGGTCIFGTSTLSGIAYYDAPSRQIYASAPNAARTDGFLFVGMK